MEFKRRNLALLLLSARESVMANFRPTLKAFGLTDQQWRILRALNSAGEMEAGQIADTCKASSPSVRYSIAVLPFVEKRAAQWKGR